MADEQESAAVQPANKPVSLLDPELTRIARIIGLMIIAGGILWALTIIWPFISMVVRTTLPFIAGLIFAYIFDPFVTFAQKKLKISRIGGVLVLYSVFAVLIATFVAMVLPILITQIRGAYSGIASFLNTQIENIPEIQRLQEDVNGWLEERGINIEEMIGQVVRSEGVQAAAQSAATGGLRIIYESLVFLYAVIVRIFGLATFLIFAVLVNIYLLVDFSKIRGNLEIMIPVKHQERTFDVMKKVDVAVGGFIRGMLTVSLLVGVMTYFGLTLVGVGEYALLLAIIAGIGNLVPYLGPIIGGAPAALFILFSGSFDGSQERLVALVGLLIVVSVIQSIESLVFQPKIVGQAAQLHPIAVLFALAFGANFGILGMLVAVPIACILRVLIKEFYWDDLERAWRERTGNRKGRKSRDRPRGEKKPA